MKTKKYVYKYYQFPDRSWNYRCRPITISFSLQPKTFFTTSYEYYDNVIEHNSLS